MAFVNPNKPSGLSPIKYLNGANYDGKGQVYSILAANTNPFYVGDLVSLVAGGGATAADAAGIPAITLATNGASILGVIVAVGANSAMFPDAGPYLNVGNLGSTIFRPSGAQTQNYYALVSDDPNIIYEIQEGGAGTNLTKSAVGRNAQFLYSAPATGVFVSGTTLDNGNANGTTATIALKIMRLSRRIDNNFVTNPSTGGGAQKWEVLINNHVFASRPAAI
jgi:hypothetical protein